MATSNEALEAVEHPTLQNSSISARIAVLHPLITYVIPGNEDHGVEDTSRFGCPTCGTVGICPTRTLVSSEGAKELDETPTLSGNDGEDSPDDDWFARIYGPDTRPGELRPLTRVEVANIQREGMIAWLTSAKPGDPFYESVIEQLQSIGEEIKPQV